MMNEKRDLALFESCISKMAGVNEGSYSSNLTTEGYFSRRLGPAYSLEEVAETIDGGSKAAKRLLSRSYFKMDGMYRRIILYYATILKYYGVLSPHFIDEPIKSAKKRYEQAIDYVEVMKLPTLCADLAVRTLIDGEYFGVVARGTNESFGMIPLPNEYARSTYKDINNNDSIDFNMHYFDLMSKEERKRAFSIYPTFFASLYRSVRGKADKWVALPTDQTLYLSFGNSGPLFLNALRATANYREYTDLEKIKDAEEIKRILVQKIPHVPNTRELLFEPPEAEKIHAGTVRMMKNNRSVSVLTTYADVDVTKTEASSETVQRNNLEKILSTIYQEAGVSPQLFATSGNLALEKSIANDTALMKMLADKVAVFVTNLLNFKFANKNVSFKWIFLNLSYYNEKESLSSAKDLATLGYSWLVPALAQGLSQRDLLDIKKLENNVLGLENLLVPLQSAYNAPSDGGKGGRPRKDEDDKSSRTLANETSKDTGGRSGEEA